PGLPEDGAGPQRDLRPDARAEVGHRDGRLCLLRRGVQQIRSGAGRGQDRAGRRLHPRLPAPPPGPDRRHPEAEGRHREGAALTMTVAPERFQAAFPDALHGVSADGIPYILVRPEQIAETARRFRDELGYARWIDLTAVDEPDVEPRFELQ